MVSNIYLSNFSNNFFLVQCNNIENENLSDENFYLDTNKSFYVKNRPLKINDTLILNEYFIRQFFKDSLNIFYGVEGHSNNEQQYFYILNVNLKTNDTLFIDIWKKLKSFHPLDYRYKAHDKRFVVSSVCEGTETEIWYFFKRKDTTILHFCNGIAVNLPKNYIVTYYIEPNNFNIIATVLDIFSKDTLQTFELEELRGRFSFLANIIERTFFKGDTLFIKWVDNLEEFDDYDFAPGSYSQYVIKINNYH